MSEHEARKDQRVKALIRVQLRSGGPMCDACVLDVSAKGLLLTTANPPARGEFVEISTDRHSLTGQVRWSSARRFGIGLRERIDIFALIQGEAGPIGAVARKATMRSASAQASAALPVSAPAASKVLLLAIIVAIAATLVMNVSRIMENTMADANTALSSSGAQSR